jgi:uncharacterized repeat protein (TIGR01451 family)
MALTWLHRRRPALERLEDRTVPSVSVLNNSGNGYAALSFNQSGGYVPPDTCGAAGPSAYVETVNQSVALYPSKSTSSNAVTDSLSHFLFTTGGLSRADSSSGLSDPIVAYDELIGRFIIGDQDVDFTNHVSAFDLAVSTSNNPSSLSSSDWTFYKITTTQTGYDADYPGNFGYNHDAFVFTLNMFGVLGGGHAQVVAVNASDLANASSSPQITSNNVSDFSLRPTTMHDSVSGDPMWLVSEHGDGKSIDVIKMTNVLTNSASFAYTNLSVSSYSSAVSPLNPNGTLITNNIDSRIQKAAEANDVIVATHSVAISSTQDVAQWYAIDVSGSTPTLSQQGRVSAGSNTYVVYPGIDVNSSGQIGMSYMKSGTDSSTDYLSMWVTGRISTDSSGTMETPVLVPAGAGQKNYDDFTSGNRAGDLSGINVDPSDGSFWAANEFATSASSNNWGTAVANFAPAAPASSADLAVIVSGPSSVTAGTNATYTVTIKNNGPSAASGAVLTNALPSGASFVSMSQTSGSDSFTMSQSGGNVIQTANAAIASGSTDVFSLVVTASAGLSPGANFSDSASVSATTSDSNTSNNSATQSGTIVGPPADLVVSASGPGSASEGDNVTYTMTVTNNGPNDATSAVLTDALGSNLRFVSATTSQGSFSQSGGAVTFSLGTISSGGSATVTVTAQAMEDGALTDSASVSATSADPDTSNNSTSASTSVTDPSINVSGPITTSDRSPSNLAVATFTHASGVEPASAFTATIDWGDGKTSSGTITLSGTTYTVFGSHRYSHGGSHKITTTVQEVGAAAQLLLGKIGDEVPGLPDQLGRYHDKGRFSLSVEVAQFRDLVRAYSDPAGSGGVTRQALTAGLDAVFAAAQDEGRSIDLAGLVASLRARARENERALDALFLIDDYLAGVNG